MTVPKVETKTKYGDRWYIDPEDGTERPGVSSIVDMMPKPALTPWAARMAAEFAVKNVESVYQLAKTDATAAVNLIKGAPWRSSGRAADAGTEVHHYVEEIGRAMMRGEKPAFKVPADVMPFLRHYARFVREFRPEPVMVETTVMHTEPGYEFAGTFDWLGRLPTVHGDGFAIIDTKTGASGVWSSAAVQQTGYRYASHYVDPDTGEKRPMPPVVATYGLWLRPEGYALIPLESTEEEWAQFRRLREAYTWKIKREKKVVLPAINENPLKRKPKWQRKS